MNPWGAAVLSLLGVIAPLAIGTDTLGPRTARLRRSTAADLSIVSALPQRSVRREALAHSVSLRAAELAARQLIPLRGGWASAMLVTVMTGLALLVISPFATSMNGIALTGGAIYLIGYTALAFYAARVNELRGRQVRAILRGYRSGAYQFRVPPLGFRRCARYRMTREAIAFQAWRQIEHPS